MSMTVKVTDDISIVFSDRLAGTLAIVPQKTGRWNRYRRLAIMRRNLLLAARSLSRESRRHAPFLDIADMRVYKDETK